MEAIYKFGNSRINIGTLKLHIACYEVDIYTSTGCSFVIMSNSCKHYMLTRPSTLRLCSRVLCQSSVTVLVSYSHTLATF